MILQTLSCLALLLNVAQGESLTMEGRCTTTRFIKRPNSFDPNVKNTGPFYHFGDLHYTASSLLRPGFYGPTVVALTGSTAVYTLIKI